MIANDDVGLRRRAIHKSSHRSVELEPRDKRDREQCAQETTPSNLVAQQTTTNTRAQLYPNYTLTAICELGHPTPKYSLTLTRSMVSDRFATPQHTFLADTKIVNEIRQYF